MIPKSAAMYASYEESRRVFAEYNGSMSTGVAFAAGWVSGIFEALTVQPFQVVKLRMQSKAYLGEYANSLDCLKKMLAAEPVTRFGRGFMPTIWRNTVWNSVYFALMFSVKDYMPRAETHTGSLLQTLLSGFVGGLVATGFNAPFDMVKSRFQEERLAPGGQYKHRSTIGTLMHVHSTEGLRACYKGLAPKAVRMALGGAVAMGAFELACVLMAVADSPGTD